ncbi:cytochrome P450 6AQ1 [Calliopsis andreniformis]|uniref:cytochrome P450 6AQ1 n=1 Tax=Calliopsis andreniformis TaxID=337506 RepID=UPI003FCD78E2
MAVLTPHWGLDGIIIFLSLIIAAYMFMTRNFKYWAKQGVAEQPPIPFFGNFLKCILQKQSAGMFLKDMYDRSKGLPYVGIYVFDKPCLVLRDPELIKHVLVKDFNSFTDKYAAVDKSDPIGYSNIFLMTNTTWKLLRSRLSPFFTSGKLKKMMDLMMVIADDLDRYLDGLDLGGPGKEIEWKDVCANFTTDMIGSTAFGLRANTIYNPNAEFKRQRIKLFHPNIVRAFEVASIFFMPDLVKYTRSKFFENGFSNFMRVAFWEVFNHRVKSGEKRNDLIDLLIELRNTYKDEHATEDFEFDGDDLVGQAAAFFTGGFETSSSTMSFTLYELALQLDIQKRLRKEIFDALEETGGKVTYEMVVSLPYLDQVIAETLRKYPPLPFVDRRAMVDYKLPGTNVVLKKGTGVYIPMVALHNDPQYYPDPDKYDPERFSEENKKNRPSCVYFPFGEGPRNCIGMRLGLIQSKLGIIQVLRKYEVTPTENTIIPMESDPKVLTTASRGGVYLNTRKITTDAG